MPAHSQSRRISTYRLQWRPSFGFESSMSSTLITSGDPVDVRQVEPSWTFTIAIAKCEEAD